MTETVTIELSETQAMTTANLLREHDTQHEHDFCMKVADEIWKQIDAQNND